MDKVIFTPNVVEEVINKYSSLRGKNREADFVAAAKAGYGKTSLAEKLVFTHALFAYKLIAKPETISEATIGKKQDFVNCLNLGDFVGDLHWNGVAHTGQTCNECSVSVDYILKVFKHLTEKSLQSVEEVNAEIRRFCEEQYHAKEKGVKWMVDILLWYVASDEYEPIISRDAKEKIVKCPDFIGLIEGNPKYANEDIVGMAKDQFKRNELIHWIRQDIVESNRFEDKKFNFYDSNVKALWEGEQKMTAAQNEREFRKWMKDVKRHTGRSIKIYANSLKNKLSVIAKEIGLIDGSLFDVTEEDEFEQAREKLKASAQFGKYNKGTRENCAAALTNYGEYLSYGENAQKKGGEKMKKTRETLSLNQIFYGPPGTGKTYGVVKAALEIIDGKVSNAREEQMKRFNELREVKQIAMVTFHQNFSYEDFIEGIKPVLEEDDKDKATEKSTSKAKENNLSYRLEDGIFKEIAKNANESKEKSKKYVLIIDEINRGNISAIFGELITLLEDDKRLGRENALSLVLPYSKKLFGVPDNLHVIGTMNTADRSIALLDTALRRRFHFFERMPDLEQIPEKKVEGVNLRELLREINNRIRIAHGREHQIGHAYFMRVKSIPDLKKVFEHKIIPLLQEYFHDNWKKIAKVVNNDELVKPDGEVESFGKEGEESAWDKAANYKKISDKRESQ